MRHSGFIFAASGIYAVYSNNITLRSQEIATRRALGANDNQVIALFLKEAGVQLFFGLAIGITLTFWVVGQIANSLVIVSSSYLIGFIGIPVFIVVMVLFATYIPSNKITKEEPSHGLRQI